MHLKSWKYRLCSGYKANRGQQKSRSRYNERLPFKWREYKEKAREASNFNIFSKQLYEYLVVFGKSADKYIPRWILDLPKDKLQIFWDAYTFGDSHRNGSGLQISSVSIKLMECLQEVALKLGTICQLRRMDCYTSPLFIFQYNPNSQNIKYHNKQIISDYTGKVWCLTLKTNSVFLVRRNGKIMFSGNCIGDNAFGSNPSWYVDGDRKNGESDKAHSQFFYNDNEFRPAEFMHFCAKMLKKEPKEAGKSPCMVMFCAFEQLHQFIELGKKYGLMHYIPLVFRKKFSAQVLKANMKIVGNCEYGLVLYRDKLPKFNNSGSMVFNCFDWPDDRTTPKCHNCQKPVPLLERIIEIFTDPGDVVIDPCAGSATTLLAAANRRREAYGFEVNREFAKEAKDKVLRRIQLNLFD